MVWPPYWKAARVVAAALANWEAFDGTLALAGVDPLALPPDRFVSAFMVWARREVLRGENGQQKWEQMVIQIDTPPVSARAARAPVEDAAEHDAQEAAAFDAYLSAVGGG